MSSLTPSGVGGNWAVTRLPADIAAAMNAFNAIFIGLSNGDVFKIDGRICQWSSNASDEKRMETGHFDGPKDCGVRSSIQQCNPDAQIGRR